MNREKTVLMVKPGLGEQAKKLLEEHGLRGVKVVELGSPQEHTEKVAEILAQSVSGPQWEQSWARRGREGMSATRR